ncbi:hypothetical protein DXD68_07070 [Parabacteroides sp. TM07-1AC]|uniref:2TM domain-containing protein n=1 Tax=Parabacteroides sp. TM07-1AC TaxID=2292363 RepID=UPI000EFE1A84|nr:2TM domain-containing protein [Parabacteroides sp. TM07-1AC]RHU29206.1 hypothetical protein DXD68_07070 [Parabacteroides sp. TM07-1AC]
MEATVNSNKKNNSFPAQLKMNILRYIVICSFLAVVNYVTTPHYWWVLWVIAGWGINLILEIVCHYMIKEEREEDCPTNDINVKSTYYKQQ